MRTDQVLTVTMTETVHHEVSLTAERLAEVTGIPLDQPHAFIAGHPDWTGHADPHGGAVECLLDVIDCDTCYVGAEDRSWTVRQPPLAPTPTAVTDPRARALAELLGAYGSNTYRLLAALADQLLLSLAYVDRETVQAHVECALSDAEWAAANDQFSGLEFDEHVGDHGTFRTDWIETVRDKAGVPGYGYTADGWHRATATGQGGAAG
jgi:hypothetical protein